MNLFGNYQAGISQATDQFAKASSAFDLNQEFKAITQLLKAVKATKQSQAANIEFIKGCAAFECDRARGMREFCDKLTKGTNKLGSKILSSAAYVNQAGIDIDLNQVLVSVSKRFNGLDVGGDIEEILGVKGLSLEKTKRSKSAKSKSKTTKHQNTNQPQQNYQNVVLHTGDSMLEEAASPQLQTQKQSNQSSYNPQHNSFNHQNQFSPQQPSQQLQQPTQTHPQFIETDAMPSNLNHTTANPRMLLTQEEEIEPVTRHNIPIKPKVLIPRYNFDDSLLDDKGDKFAEIDVPGPVHSKEIPLQPDVKILSTDELKQQIEHLRQLEQDLMRSSGPTIDVDQ